MLLGNGSMAVYADDPTQDEPAVDRLPVLTLPAALKEIGKEAFCGDESLGEVVLPDAVETIGESAFAGSSLKRINLPASLKTIDDSAFDRVENLVVTANMGTYAYDWAVNKGIAVEADEPEPVSYTVTYYANGGTFPNGATSVLGILTEEYLEENGFFVGDLGDNGWADTPERAGYVFVGWCENPERTEEDPIYDDGSLNSDHYPDVLLITGDLDLYACWVEEEPARTLSVTMDDVTQSNKMTTAFIPNVSWSDGTEVSGADYQWYKLSDGAWVEIPGTSSMTRYDFAPTIDMNGTRYKVVVTCDGQEAEAEALLTVGYRVLYDAYYGEFPDGERHIILIVTDGEHVVGDMGNGETVPDPTREGYEFSGWFDAAFTQEYVKGSVLEVNDDIILYAYWPKDVPEEVTVTLTADVDTVFVNAYDYTSSTLTIYTDIDGLDESTAHSYVWQISDAGEDFYWFGTVSLRPTESTFAFDPDDADMWHSIRLVIDDEVFSDPIYFYVESDWTCPECQGTNGYHAPECSHYEGGDDPGGDDPGATCPECGGTDGWHEEWCPYYEGDDDETYGYMAAGEPQRAAVTYIPKLSA